MDSRDVIKKLEAAGWRKARIKGSHHHFTHPDKSWVVTVPHPCKDLKPGLIRALEKQSGVRLR